MYKTINDVHGVAKDFYFEEIVSEPNGELIDETYEAAVYDEETFEPTGETETRTRQVAEMHDVIYVRQIARPETKGIDDLERLIKLGKPNNLLVKFSDMVALGEQWSWFDLYVSYQKEFDAYRTARAVFESVLSSDGRVPQYNGDKPSRPPRPETRMGEEILKPYLREIFKKSRTALVEKITVEVDSMIFDGDESAQDRMARAVLVLDGDETTLWVLANNEPVRVSKFQLLTALKLAGQAQTDLWT
jgi:hypothetical protein